MSSYQCVHCHAHISAVCVRARVKCVRASVFMQIPAPLKSSPRFATETIHLFPFVKEELSCCSCYSFDLPATDEEKSVDKSHKSG